MAEINRSNLASESPERDEGPTPSDGLDAEEEARNRMGGFRHNHTAESVDTANETDETKRDSDHQDIERTR